MIGYIPLYRPKTLQAQRKTYFWVSLITYHIHAPERRISANFTNVWTIDYVKIQCNHELIHVVRLKYMLRHKLIDTIDGSWCTKLLAVDVVTMLLNDNQIMTATITMMRTTTRRRWWWWGWRREKTSRIMNFRMTGVKLKIISWQFDEDRPISTKSRFSQQSPRENEKSFEMLYARSYATIMPYLRISNICIKFNRDIQICVTSHVLQTYVISHVLHKKTAVSRRSVCFVLRC